MTARGIALAAFAALFLAFALAGCAGSSAKAAKVSAAEADSLRTPFLLSWKAGNDAGAFDGALYIKKGFSRMELYGPMGVPVASVVWDGAEWKACLHAARTLVLGSGDVIPDSLTAGLGRLSVSELQRAALAEAQPPGSVRWLNPRGWVQLNAKPSEPDPEWGSWVAKFDCPADFATVDARGPARP